MYIYAFGSVCRGEIDVFSDVDMLAILDDKDDFSKFDPNKFSIYTEKKIKDYWFSGNPFSWHLFLESSLIYSDNKNDFIQNLGEPEKYKDGIKDLWKFKEIFNISSDEIKISQLTYLFELSTIFLCIRNFATCYSLHNNKPNFSRDSALKLDEKSLIIDNEIYQILENSRLLATRGYGNFPTKSEILKIMLELDKVNIWMDDLIGDVHE